MNLKFSCSGLLQQICARKHLHHLHPASHFRPRVACVLALSACETLPPEASKRCQKSVESLLKGAQVSKGSSGPIQASKNQKGSAKASPAGCDQSVLWSCMIDKLPCEIHRLNCDVWSVDWVETKATTRQCPSVGPEKCMPCRFAKCASPVRAHQAWIVQRTCTFHTKTQDAFLEMNTVLWKSLLDANFDAVLRVKFHRTNLGKQGNSTSCYMQPICIFTRAQTQEM